MEFLIDIYNNFSVYFKSMIDTVKSFLSTGDNIFYVVLSIFAFIFISSIIVNIIYRKEIAKMPKRYKNDLFISNNNLFMNNKLDIHKTSYDMRTNPMYSHLFCNIHYKND